MVAFFTAICASVATLLVFSTCWYAIAMQQVAFCPCSNRCTNLLSTAVNKQHRHAHAARDWGLQHSVRSPRRPVLEVRIPRSGVDPGRHQ